MAVIETWLKQDLNTPVRVQMLDGKLFTQDGNGNRIGVEVFKDGEPYTLDGSIQGYCVLADGSTVPATGMRSGNKASILIPPSAYLVVGAIQIVIKNTSGSTITTLGACVSYVTRSRTSSETPGGSVITDWTNQITAQLQACQDAADNMGSMVAVPYANLTFPVVVGTYTTYNGNLYCCTTAISTSEDFTSSHWRSAKVGDELRDLKAALDNTRNSLSERVGIYPTTWNQGFIEKAVSENNKSIYSSPIPVEKGTTIQFDKVTLANVNYYAYYYRTAEITTASYIGNVNINNLESLTISNASEAKFVRIRIGNSTSAITPALGYENFSAYIRKNTLNELKVMELATREGLQKVVGIIPSEWYQGYIQESITPAIASIYSNAVPVKSGDAITYSFSDDASLNCYLYYYKTEEITSQSYIGNVQIAGDGHTVISGQSEAKYIRFRIGNANSAQILPLDGYQKLEAVLIKDSAAIENLIDRESLQTGYYNEQGTLVQSSVWLNEKTPCNPGERIYTNLIPRQQYTVTYFDSNSTFVSQQSLTGITTIHNYFDIPDDDQVAFFAFSIPYSKAPFAVLSRNKFTLEVWNNSYTSKEKMEHLLYRALDKNTVFSDYASAAYTKVEENGWFRIDITDTSELTNDWWHLVSIESMKGKLGAPLIHYLLAYNEDNAIGVSLATAGKLIVRRLNLKGTTSTNLLTLDYQAGFSSLFYSYQIELSTAGKVIFTNLETGDQIKFSIASYIDTSYKMSTGFVHLGTANMNGLSMYVFDSDFGTADMYKVSGINVLTNHWNGKKWFAYGTSLTHGDSFWVNETATELGLLAYNKGIGGAGITTFSDQKNYNAVFDSTDGKADADLITFEFGANDRRAALGDIDSFDNSTILGAANQCIRELYRVCPKAQIIIMPSLSNRYDLGHPESPHGFNYLEPGGWTRIEFLEAVRKLAYVLGTHFAPFGTEFSSPYYRSFNPNYDNPPYDNKYIKDLIHPSALGARNITAEMVEYISHIPLWIYE